MRNSQRLIALIVVLGIYAILSTTFVIRNLLRAEEVIYARGEVLVIDENDDGTDDGNSNDDDSSNESGNSLQSQFICNTQNASDFLPLTDMIRRSLHGVIIGTMKGGTQALHKMLLTHPNILTSGTGHGELHFFNQYYKKIASNSGYVIPRNTAREYFLKILRDRKSISKHKEKDILHDMNKDKVGFHSAPIYLFSGRKIPARILCTAPWIKAIVILRNPIDRAFSHYHFKYTNLKGKEKIPTFEQYIADDISLLKRIGVLRDWNTTNFTAFAGSPDEYTAWEQYSTLAKGNGPVGRGLYSIQLEIWMEEFKKINKSIDDDLLILQSESTKQYPEDAYHQSVQFFGLEPRTEMKHNHVFIKDHHATDYSESELSEEMYQMLYDLFEPYNKRLYSLLGNDWVNVWDDSNKRDVNKTNTKN